MDQWLLISASCADLDVQSLTLIEYLIVKHLHTLTLMLRLNIDDLIPVRLLFFRKECLPQLIIFRSKSDLSTSRLISAHPLTVSRHLLIITGSPIGTIMDSTCRLKCNGFTSGGLCYDGLYVAIIVGLISVDMVLLFQIRVRHDQVRAKFFLL